jgi:hypothetical protein
MKYGLHVVSTKFTGLVATNIILPQQKIEHLTNGTKVISIKLGNTTNYQQVYSYGVPVTARIIISIGSRVRTWFGA